MMIGGYDAYYTFHTLNLDTMTWTHVNKLLPDMVSQHPFMFQNEKDLLLINSANDQVQCCQMVYNKAYSNYSQAWKSAILRSANPRLEPAFSKPCTVVYVLLLYE